MNNKVDVTISYKNLEFDVCVGFSFIEKDWKHIIMDYDYTPYTGDVYDVIVNWDNSNLTDFAEKEIEEKEPDYIENYIEEQSLEMNELDINEHTYDYLREDAIIDWIINHFHVFYEKYKDEFNEALKEYAIENAQAEIKYQYRNNRKEK